MSGRIETWRRTLQKNHDDEMKKIASKIYRYVHEEFSQGNTDVVYNQCRMEAECDTQATLGITTGGAGMY